MRRDPLHLEQHAVDAGADDESVGLRLEVDVAGPVLGGLVEDRVDEANERRVGDPVVRFELIIVVDDLERVEVDRAAAADRFARSLEALDLLENVVAGVTASST